MEICQTCYNSDKLKEHERTEVENKNRAKDPTREKAR